MTANVVSIALSGCPKQTDKTVCDASHKLLNRIEPCRTIDDGFVGAGNKGSERS